MRITNTGNVGINTTSPSFSLDVNGASRGLQLLAGTSTDTSFTRLISALDSNIGTSVRAITLGKANSANNQIEIGYQHRVDGSATNLASFGFHSAPVTSRMYMLAGGNVGFGTSAPDKEVEINSPTGDCLRLTYNDSDGSASTYADVLMGSNGNLILNPTGVFITTPKRFQVTATGNGFSHLVSGGAELMTYVDTTAGSFGTYSNHDYRLMSNNNTRMTITASGNIGIGTTTPGYLFDVYGIGRINQLLVGDSTDTGRLISALDSTMGNGSNRYFSLGKANSTNNQAEISYTHISNGSSSNYLSLGLWGSADILTVNGNRRVGVNTSSPEYSLDVNGTIKTSSNFYNSSQSVAPQFGGKWMADGFWGFGPDNTSTGTGSSVQILRLGLCTSPNTFSGSYGWLKTNITSPSDYRLKTDITPLKYNLDDILKLKPISYKIIGNNEKNIGFLAHEMQDIIPEVVIGEKDEINKDGSNRYQSISYSNLTSLLVKGVQDLHKENMELKKTINEILQRLSNLESK
jgi:hypothetical protein